jgi:hypothetical protein
MTPSMLLSFLSLAISIIILALACYILADTRSDKKPQDKPKTQKEKDEKSEEIRKNILYGLK